MKKLHPTTQFKKDFKRIEKEHDKVAAFEMIADLLINEQPIPSEFRPHMLRGQYKGCMECHIENDFLLIWMDAESDIIELLRIGSHSELFK